MTLTRLVVAPLSLVSVILLLQGAPAQKPDAKATFGIMKANVAKITEQGEKDRWQTNVDAWSVEVASSGKIQKADLEKIATSLTKMKANVAKVTEAAEKERWQVNVDLWQFFVSGQGAVAKADMAAASKSLDAMTANVAKVTAQGEKERWQANRDLWRAFIGSPK